jgi:hypothetical protein
MPAAARSRRSIRYHGAQRRAFGYLKLKRRWRWVASGIAGRSFHQRQVAFKRSLNRCAR